MHRNQALLAIATLLSTACADDRALPDAFLGAEAADLSGARLPDDVLRAAEAPLTDADRAAGIPFVVTPVEEVDAMLSTGPGAPGARFGRDVLVAVRWGYFPARPAMEWVDWSGFVAVSRGRVEVVRPLRFEDGGAGDFVLPDADPRVVRFTSHTRPAADGLLLRVHRPDFRPSVLVIRAGGETRVLPFEELYDLDAAEVVTAGGHELRVRAHTPPPGPCMDVVATGTATWSAGDLTGTLAGHTLDGETLDVAGPYARFRARLLDGGTEIGRMRGVYADFHYAADAGRLVGMARGDEPGGVLGQWSAGTADLRLIRRAPECAAE